jgi:dihydropyrimidinase
VSLLVKGARVVTAADDYTADVFVAEDTVTMIAAALDIPADHVIDAAGCYLLPGGMHQSVVARTHATGTWVATQWCAVRTVIAAGRAIVDNGVFTGKPASGRYIARDASGQQQRDEGAR